MRGEAERAGLHLSVEDFLGQLAGIMVLTICHLGTPTATLSDLSSRNCPMPIKPTPVEL